MPQRNAARVLPDPVGARISVWSPAAIGGQPWSWASVGAAKLDSNHARTGAENRSSGTRYTIRGGCDTEPRRSPGIGATDVFAPIPGKAPARRLTAVPDYVSPEWHPAFEEYCETIFE